MLLAISQEFGKSVDWLLTGEDTHRFKKPGYPKIRHNSSSCVAHAAVGGNCSMQRVKSQESDGAQSNELSPRMPRVEEPRSSGTFIRILRLNPLLG